jgi:hypothetical protein
VISEDITKRAKQAGLKISGDDSTLEIRQRFRSKDQSNFGILVLFAGGVFSLALPFIRSSGLIVDVVAIGFGLLVIVLSILSLIRVVVDKLTVTSASVTIRHYLRRKTVPLSRGMTIRMKTRVTKVRRPGKMESEFITVSHHLQHANGETPILDFQMNNLDSREALELGHEIKRLIRDRIYKADLSTASNSCSS